MQIDLTTTELVLALAAGMVGAAYVALILVPAWESYGRVWERVAASFLTLFTLATLLGAGAAIGFAVVWFYDRWA
ncbi:MAG: hypothetical protein ACM3UV_03840 [Nocardioidaceae bacterium]